MKTYNVFFVFVLGCLGAEIHPADDLAKLALDIRVLNGVPAGDGEFPFIVSIQYNGNHICGATLLSTEYLLTAAHCVGKNMKGFTVRAGTNNRKSGGSVHRIVHWKRHENYKTTAHWNNDIAVVMVSPPLKLSSKVKLVKLPAKNSEPTPRSTSTAIGWGKTCVTCPLATNLQKVNLKILSLEDCLNYYSSGPTEDMVCSGIPEESKGSCGGDSGGPLMAYGVQIGVTSWGAKPCAKFPGIWTKVSHYRSWIKANTGV